MCFCVIFWDICYTAAAALVCEHCVYPGELSCASVAMILRSSKSPNFVAQTFDTCGGQTHKELVSCDMLICNWRLNHNWNTTLYLQRFGKQKSELFLKIQFKRYRQNQFNSKNALTTHGERQGWVEVLPSHAVNIDRGTLDDTHCLLNFLCCKTWSEISLLLNATHVK